MYNIFRASKKISIDVSQATQQLVSDAQSSRQDDETAASSSTRAMNVLVLAQIECQPYTR